MIFITNDNNCYLMTFIKKVITVTVPGKNKSVNLVAYKKVKIFIFKSLGATPPLIKINKQGHGGFVVTHNASNIVQAIEDTFDGLVLVYVAALRMTSSWKQNLLKTISPAGIAHAIWYMVMFGTCYNQYSMNQS